MPKYLKNLFFLSEAIYQVLFLFLEIWRTYYFWKRAIKKKQNKIQHHNLVSRIKKMKFVYFIFWKIHLIIWLFFSLNLLLFLIFPFCFALFSFSFVFDYCLLFSFTLFGFSWYFNVSLSLVIVLVFFLFFFQFCLLCWFYFLSFSPLSKGI